MKLLPATALVVCLVAAAALAQTTAASAPSAEVKLVLVTEEGRQLQATVSADGKPVEGATVVFTVQRTFGDLPIGKDQTLDDGTAQVPFPSDLPGGPTGELAVTATVQAPEKWAGATAKDVFPGAAKLATAAEPFPRALWAPRAPWLLVVTIAGLLLVVWCMYAYVATQLWAIARGR